ncbi:MAG: right-handed parallel beta-helix repeat-containing protein, partial [Bacteroidota bacterium]
MLFANTIQAQSVIYVDSSRAANGNGSAWSQAYKYLADAMVYANATPAVKEIRVAKGTYYPTGEQSGTNRATAFLVSRTGYKLSGWYPSGAADGTIARDSVANPVILDGNINNPADSTDNSYHIMVVAASSATDSVIIDGMIVQNGGSPTASSSTVYAGVVVSNFYGGGLYKHGTALVQLASCSFLKNASSIGGGVYGNTGQMSVKSCTFRSNATTLDGGGFYLREGGTITGCIFTDNSSSRQGGAFFGQSGTFAFNNCSFSRNSSTNSGGAINLIAGSIDVSTCIFTNNTSNVQGGAIYSAAPATVTNSVFTGNQSLTADGGAIYTSAGLTVTGCTFTTNAANSAGAISIAGSAGTIRNSAFAGNVARTTYGGAVSSTATTTYSFCSFTGNKAPSGGALSVANGGGTINKCSFISDSASGLVDGAGAIYFSSTNSLVNTTLTIYTSTFSGNGGEVATIFKLGSGTLNVSSCLFTGNVGTGNNGYVLRASGLNKIANCTFAGNSTLSGFLVNGSNSIINSIFWGNSNNTGIDNSNASYSVIENLDSPANNNLNTDPLFEVSTPSSASGFVVPASNYNLQAGSPAVNTGNLSALTYPNDSVDVLGNLRVTCSQLDRGAVERTCDTPLPSVLYVDPAGANGDGQSWSQAYNYLNDALVYANKYFEVKEIRIAKGTYYPTRLQGGTQRDTSFYMSRGYKLLGGYATGGSATSDIVANPVILDGNINNPSDSTDNSYHLLVVADQVQTDSILVDGINFRNATGNITSTMSWGTYSINYSEGGGIHIASGKARVSNCTFTANHAAFGAGVCTRSLNPTVVNNCSFSTNRTQSSGAGIYTLSELYANGCTFTNNTSAGSGGALRADSKTTLSTCTFSGNSCQTIGGAILVQGGATSTMTYTDCNFLNNTTLQSGGAISTSGTGKYTNCTFTGNTATGSSSLGGAVHSSGPASFTGCILSGNSSGLLGGAVYMAGTTLNTLNCTFTNNTAETSGGAVHTQNTAATSAYTNTGFTGNKARTGSGGALSLTATYSLSKCTFTGNTAT